MISLVRRMRVCLLLLVLAVVTVSAMTASAAPKLPDATGYVNDFASILTNSEKSKLEQKISEGVKQTGAQVAVAIVKDTEGYSAKEYAVALFQKWGIGQKGKDNGLLILLVMDQRSLEIEVGYGLEAVITDSIAGRIRDQYLIPQFQQGKYALGLEQAIDDIYGRIGASGATASPESPGSNVSPIRFLFPILIAMVLVIAAILVATVTYTKRRDRCPNCGKPLKRKERVIRAATAMVPGLVAVTWLCGQCGYSRTVQKTVNFMGPGVPGMGGPWLGGPWLGGPWFGGGKGGHGGGAGGGGFGGFGGGKSGGGGAGGHW